ncbi:MAG: hypothetical protein QOI35_3658 [Cryptosporangiaceae bacterium]|jgi:diguanylate cyclase (GGDEF)-like protein|nr:hypothetical protein [Cryptosporangiaceae bacterium]
MDQADAAAATRALTAGAGSSRARRYALPGPPSAPAARTGSPRRWTLADRAAITGYGILGLLMAGYLVSVLVRPRGRSIPLLDDLLINVVQVTAALGCIAGAFRRRAGRSVWLVLGFGLLVWTLGDVAWTSLAVNNVVPTPSVADGLFIAFYPMAYLAVIMLIRTGSEHFLPSTWLDGLLCGLSAAAVCAAVGLSSTLHSSAGSPLEVAVNLAYPVGDLILLAFAVGALALLPDRRDARWWLLGVGSALFAVCDSIYLLQAAAETYRVGTLLDIGWPVAIILMSAAAWARPARRAVMRLDGAALLVMPGAAAATGLAILVYGCFRPVDLTAVVLASAALLAAAGRVLLSLRDLRQLSESRRQALTDDLTGLANRRMFTQRLTARVQAYAERAGHNRGQLTVLVVDLDRFKEVNDAFGHPVGDDLLTQVGDRLHLAVRPSDLIARLGGDEFALLLDGSDTDRATMLAERFVTGLEQPFALTAASVEISASIGIARYPDDAATAAGLLRCADAAMYRAKAAHEPFAVYDHARDDSRDRFQLSSDLRKAIDSNQLVLHYQPKRDLSTGTVTAVEALVRWPHPDRGLLAPDAFIPLAESAGLMGALTAFVLDAALAQCAAWHAGGRDLAVAVNLSGNDLLDVNLVGDVRALLARHDVPATALTLEITEGTLLTDINRARDVIEQLQELGIVVSIDDFGTGFSSLAYLHGLTVAELKLDRYFISNLATADRDVEIVRSIITLAHALGLRVVAEGIEDPETLRLLTDLDCDIAQGYHIGRPVPPGELAPISET